MTDVIETLLTKLSRQEIELLRAVLLKDAVTEQLSGQTDTTLLYNRSPKDFEFQWDSRPYIVGAHKYVTLPTGIARHAVRASQYRYVGTEQVEEFIVPQGYKTFGIPIGDDPLTGDPVKDSPIVLRAVEGEVPLREGQTEVFSLVKAPIIHEDPLPLGLKIPEDRHVSLEVGQ